MLTFILSYFGGVLTIFSPCVLPVIPFIFSRSDEPFRKSGLPILVGMALSFAGFTFLSVIGGQWVVQASQVGRALALVIFAVLGLSLLLPRLSEKLFQPVVRLGGLLQRKADSQTGIGSSLLLGASVGLLWAPCAGPILGLVLAGASLSASPQKTLILLLFFAMGAATSLAIAIFSGGKVLSKIKKNLGAEEWIKKGLGVFVLIGVVAIALGLDTKLLSRFSYFNTNSIEQGLIEKISGKSSMVATNAATDEGVAPSFEGATTWLNSPELKIAALQGKVVLVDFWTYSCINCIRTLPYVKAWAEKYRDQGLVVVGVHSPEFAFEKDLTNVKKAIQDFGITYPVAVDNDQKIWSAYQNQFWPAHYLIDAKGKIRYHHFGEGNEDESEKIIQQLLSETTGKAISPIIPSVVKSSGAEAPPSTTDEVASPETYLGYERQEGFVGTPDIQKSVVTQYHQPKVLNLNQWSLDGGWKVDAEMASSTSKNAKLSFRFRARDLHLVMGAPNGKTIHYRVTIDGLVTGKGVVDSNRLYQLIRQKKSESEHTFQIEFLEEGAEVFAFTFG